MWYTYILTCSDDSYYVGHANNLEARLARHNAGRGCKWTACRLPVRLAYAESHETEEQALSREMQIKRWSRAKKEALIQRDTSLLRQLAKRKANRSSA